MWSGSESYYLAVASFHVGKHRAPHSHTASIDSTFTGASALNEVAGRKAVNRRSHASNYLCLVLRKAQ